MDSTYPDSLSSQSPLDSMAGDVRQRLIFDWHESRLGETAEPDPLSSGSPQQAQHTQLGQHEFGAMSNSFQVPSHIMTCADDHTSHAGVFAYALNCNNLT